METIKYILKMGLSRLTSVGLVEKGRNCVTMLTGNATFASLPGLLPALTTACDELEESNLEVIFHGGVINHDLKRVREKTLYNLLVGMAEQVQVISGGDKAKILSAGFEVRKQREPINSMEKPGKMRGREVRQIRTNGLPVFLDVADLQAGNYIVVVGFGVGRRATRSFVKE